MTQYVNYCISVEFTVFQNASCIHRQSVVTMMLSLKLSFLTSNFYLGCPRQKDPTHRIFSKFSILLFKLYLAENQSKNLQLPMKKYFMSVKLLNVKNNSHADMTTSHTQLLGKGCQHGEEDFKNKILS